MIKKLDYRLVKKIFDLEKQRYNLNKGLFIYIYKTNDKVTTDVVNISNETVKKKKVDEILKQLEGINNKFKTQVQQDGLPNNVELERLHQNEKTTDQIKQEAESSLVDYKNAQINSIQSESDNRKKDLVENKNILNESVAEQKDNLKNYYDTAKQSASDEALKRGLARSSIVVSQLSAFDNNQIENFKKLDEQLTNKVDAINFELQGLNSELDSALNDFNIAYAVKLQDKINALNTELNNSNAQITKYNNEIALKEAEYNQKLVELKNDMENQRFDNETDILDIYGKYGSGVVAKVVQDSLYDAMKKQLAGLSKQEIAELINDPNVKSMLGNNVYSVLVKEFGL